LIGFVLLWRKIWHGSKLLAAIYIRLKRIGHYGRRNIIDVESTNVFARLILCISEIF
jgi:hypothetical protein